VLEEFESAMEVDGAWARADWSWSMGASFADGSPVSLVFKHCTPSGPKLPFRDLEVVRRYVAGTKRGRDEGPETDESPAKRVEARP
jgi:hypothetical protein